MKKTDIGTKCPYCGTENEAASSMGIDDVPSGGAAMVCWTCGTPAMFTEDLKVRKATLTERCNMLFDYWFRRSLVIRMSSSTPAIAGLRMDTELLADRTRGEKCSD